MTTPLKAPQRAVHWAFAPMCALLLAGCEPPDRPPALPGDLPTAAVRFLQPDRVATFPLEEGVTYRSIRSRTQPWIVHLLEVMADRCEVAFRVVRPEDGEGRVPVTQMTRRLPHPVLAAVNGDFFTPEDLPVGVEVAQGGVRGRAARPVFAWRPGTAPWMGPARWEADTLFLGEWDLVTSTRPDGVTEAIAGFPALLEGGQWVGDLEQEERPAFAAQRHPRTALGWNPATGVLWVVVVEGRREGVSEGMTLPELTEFVKALGSTAALNLDGGGSSIMVIRGEVVSRPSDLGGERAVVNGLAVIWDPTLCGGSPFLPAEEK